MQKLGPLRTMGAETVEAKAVLDVSTMYFLLQVNVLK